MSGSPKEYGYGEYGRSEYGGNARTACYSTYNRKRRYYSKNHTRWTATGGGGGSDYTDGLNSVISQTFHDGSSYNGNGFVKITEI